MKTNQTELENIKEEEETSKSDEYIECISKEKLTELQKQDSSIQKILQKGKKNFSFYKDNGIIFCKDNRRDIDTGKVVVPVILRERLMTIGHDSKMAGHLGIAKTSDRIKANFYWPGMTEDVRRYCKSCDVYVNGRYTKEVWHQHHWERCHLLTYLSRE